MVDGSEVVKVLNTYSLWRLMTSQIKDKQNNDLFLFEVWLDTETDKNNLFNSLKVFVDKYGHFINWHECTHDEESFQSCLILEEYKRA